MAEPRRKLGKYQIEYVKIGALKEHPQNPRLGDVDLIQQSIEENDFYTPIIAQKGTRLILIGNHRWKAAKAVGLTEVPVVFHDVDDSWALAMMLSDNRSGDKSSYDDERLLEVLDSYAQEHGDLVATLFSMDEKDALAGIDDSYDDLGEDEDTDREDEYKRRVTECPKCAHVFVPDTFVQKDF